MGIVRLMDRTEFEALRDLPGKTIHGDVSLALAPRTQPLCAVDDVPITPETSSYS